MSRKINPQISARPSVTVSEQLAEARLPQQQREQAAVETAVSGSSKPGVSDSAASRDIGTRLADRLPGVTGDAGTSDGDVGAGAGASAESGDLSLFVDAEPTGASATIGDVQRALAGRFEAPGLADGPQRVDAEAAIADAKAGLPGSSLREESSSMLFDLAGGDDGVRGIAEQGSGAVSDSDDPATEPPAAPTPAAPEPPSLLTKEGRVAFMERLFGGGSGSGVPGAKDGVGGVERTTGDVDLTTVSTDTLRAANLIQSNLIRGDADTAEVVKRTPENTIITQTDAGVRTATMVDGTVVIKRPDGTTTVRETDGSTITLHPNKDVTETPPTRPSQPSAGIPDPEGGDDFRVVSEGLKDRLAPQGVEGGGDIDFGDDIPFGVGAGAQFVDTRGVLLGDAGRAGSVQESPATSGFGGLDLVRGSGAVDFEEETPFGGGLEDDPLAGSQPDQDLEGGLRITDSGEDEDDGSAGGSAADGNDEESGG